MADWKKDMEDLLREAGIIKKEPDFTKAEEIEIQKFIDGTIKPAFKKMKEELGSYPGIAGEIVVAKKTPAAVVENIEFRVQRIMQVKFIYRPGFVRTENGLEMKGSYSISDFYGQGLIFDDTRLKAPLSAIDEQKIISDFIENLKGNLK